MAISVTRLLKKGYSTNPYILVTEELGAMTLGLKSAHVKKNYARKPFNLREQVIKEQIELFLKGRL